MGFIKHHRKRIKAGMFREDEVMLSNASYSSNKEYRYYKIVIYAAAHKKHFKGMKHVELYFDYEKRLIGFAPMAEESEDSYILTGASGNKSFSCKTFFLENDIDVGPTGFMRCKLHYDDGYLVCSVDPKLSLGFDSYGTRNRKRLDAALAHSENAAVTEKVADIEEKRNPGRKRRIG